LRRIPKIKANGHAPVFRATELSNSAHRLPGLEIAGPMSDSSKWMYSLDVFVSTSTGDGQIYGALQAMAAGCVCLLSNVAAHIKAFLSIKQRLLFDPKDSKSFATALNDIRNDKAIRDMLFGNARYMLERFHNAETFQGKAGRNLSHGCETDRGPRSLANARRSYRTYFGRRAAPPTCRRYLQAKS
jgi:glycosyltransferase involved in cell wall biosynthesis